MPPENISGVRVIEVRVLRSSREGDGVQPGPHAVRVVGWDPPSGDSTFLGSVRDLQRHGCLTNAARSVEHHDSAVHATRCVAVATSKFIDTTQKISPALE